MRLERKHAVLFLAIAAWNVWTYVTFAKNLAAAHSAAWKVPWSDSMRWRRMPDPPVGAIQRCTQV